MDDLDPRSSIMFVLPNRVREFLEDKPGAIADYQKAAELYQKNGNTKDYQDALKHLQILQK